MTPPPTNAAAEPGTTGAASRPPHRWSRGRRRLILIGLSLLVAAVLLGLLEGGLRLAGYGGYPPTFRAAGRLPDGSTLVFSDHGGPSSYFFANRSNPGSLDRDAFVIPKPAGTIRVMVVGESAAKGIPQPRGLAWSAFLEAMLADRWPDKRVEVINVGVTAIASFPVLGILTESLDQQPDVVVVWVGNNEFYGAYGVASLHSAGRSPGMIRAIRASRSLAIAQFLDRQLSPPAGELTKTLMETMIGRSSLGPDDPARAAAARNLEVFVAEMASRCRARGVPLVVCTPPSNERDLAPLGDRPWPQDLRTRFEGFMTAAAAKMESDPAAAERELRATLPLARDHPLAAYRLAVAMAALAKNAEAAVMFRRAVDLDPMPWRPPSASVEAVRRAAARHTGDGVSLCDLETAFRAASPGGSTGWELMDDHVHPSLAGQELAAREVATVIASIQGLPAGRPPEGWPEGDYQERLGANAFEAYGVAYSMRLLAQVWFFRETNPEFFARTDRACREFEATLSPELAAAVRAWAEQPTRDGERRPIGGMVGRVLLTTGRGAEAEPLLRVAASSVVPFGSWELEYTALWLKSRRAANGGLDDHDRQAAREALSRGEFLLSTGRSTTGAAEWFMGELHQLLGDHAAAVPLLEAARAKLPVAARAEADAALVEAYLRSGAPEKARAVIAEGLEARGEHYPMYLELLAKLQREQSGG